MHWADCKCIFDVCVLVLACEGGPLSTPAGRRGGTGDNLCSRLMKWNDLLCRFPQRATPIGRPAAWKTARQNGRASCSSGRDGFHLSFPRIIFHSQLPLTNWWIIWMRAVTPGSHSASWCVGSDILTILTNMTCDRSAQTGSSPAGFSGSNVQCVMQSESVLYKSL